MEEITRIVRKTSNALSEGVLLLFTVQPVWDKQIIVLRSACRVHGTLSWAYCSKEFVKSTVAKCARCSSITVTFNYIFRSI